MTSADTLPLLMQATTGKHLAMLDDPSSDGELAHIIAAQHQENHIMEIPMSRTTSYYHNVKALGDAIGCESTNADVVLVRALETITKLGVNKDLSQEEWMRLGAKFFNERA